MKRIISTTMALFVAMAMAIGFTGTAQAAPVTYTSTTQSPLLQVAGLLNVFTVTGIDGVTYDPATGTITSPVVGNPVPSQRVIQQGGIVLEKPDGNQLEIKNIMYDVKAEVVTGVVTWTSPEGVVTEYGRVELYTAEKTSDTTTELYTAEEGGAIMREFVNLFGLPVTGAHFGTSTLLHS